MKVKRIYIFLIAVHFYLLFSAYQGWAQEPLTIALYNESTAVPPSLPSMKPFHPGIGVGVDRGLYENNHYKTYLSLNLRYVFHKNLYKALIVSLDFGYDLKMQYGGSLKTGFGIGYMHSFNVSETYDFNGGEFTVQRDHGRSRFISLVSFGLGHRFDPNNYYSDELFYQQQFWIELPYSPGFIPLMSHSSSVVGTKIFTED